MFPGAGAQVYHNEAGEPTGWDYPQYDEGPDPDDFDGYGDEPDGDGYVCDDDGEEFDSLDKFNEHREHEHDDGEPDEDDEDDEVFYVEQADPDDYAVPQDIDDRWADPDTNDGIEFARGDE